MFLCRDKCRFEMNIRNRCDYDQGERRCDGCSYNKMTSDTVCYCCSRRMRTKPRIGKIKKAMLATVSRY